MHQETIVSFPTPYTACSMTFAEEATSRARQSRKEGDLAAAREHYAEAAKLYQQANDPLTYAHSIRHIADIHQEEHNAAAARPLYEEALEIYRSNLNTKLLDLANTVRPYALLLEQQGDTASAKRHWEEARNLYASLRLDAGVTECNMHLAALNG